MPSSAQRADSIERLDNGQAWRPELPRRASSRFSGPTSPGWPLERAHQFNDAFSSQVSIQPQRPQLLPRDGYARRISEGTSHGRMPSPNCSPKAQAPMLSPRSAVSAHTYPPTRLTFPQFMDVESGRPTRPSAWHNVAYAPLALFREDQRHNLWLTMSIIGRVLYGFGPVIIVSRFEQVGGNHDATGSPTTAGIGGPMPPQSGGQNYTPLGIAWPAALAVIGAGLGFAASIGNWNDGKKINRSVARRNWTLHNLGIILQLTSHFTIPLSEDHLSGSNQLVAFLPSAVSAACLWNTIPASYSASASTRTVAISERAVARRMEACNWLRGVGGMFMSLWFGSYVVHMHPLATETFNIAGVLAVLLSFSMLMIPLRVITAVKSEHVEETHDQRAWRQFAAMGGMGLMGPMNTQCAVAIDPFAPGLSPFDEALPASHYVDDEAYDDAESVRAMTI